MIGKILITKCVYDDAICKTENGISELSHDRIIYSRKDQDVWKD